MTPRIALILLTFLAPAPAIAADGAASAVEIWQSSPETVFDARDVELDDFKWLARPVVIFADAPENPAFKSQIELLEARLDELVERDVVARRSCIETSAGDGILGFPPK